MHTFESDGLGLACYDEGGDGPPVALVHGFAASFDLNWRQPGWIDWLSGAGRRVVGLDCRGHGRSDKPHDSDAYAGSGMADDVVRMLDHFGLERVDLMGYSMGGWISTQLLTRHSDRLRRVVLGGIGSAANPRTDRSGVADALQGGRANTEVERGFRTFAEAGGNDLDALAAVMRAPRRGPAGASELAQVKSPVLIVVGGDDALIDDPQGLAKSIPGSRLVVIPGRDHLTVVGDHRYRDAVLQFLGEPGA